ncbi:MAG: glycosyltransferase family 9 protein [Planctomycetes bacterium]|nr:glycosyltransferase family 9 protein [Planctomycetota bacterium]MCW8134694.1 glycosyltransferase family 9 protein [Planctomycetota bacterium]
MRKPPWLSTNLARLWARWRAWRRPPTALAPLPPHTPARILVANTTGIGDTIFCTAAIADLAESFPNAEIDVFVDRRRVGLVKHNPRIAKVVTYHGKYKKVQATLHELRSRQYEVAVIQHVNDPDVVPLIVWGGAKHLVGYRSHTLSRLYSVALPPADKAGGAHTIDARLALCKAVGAKGEHWHTELYPSPEASEKARALLAEFHIPPGVAIALNIGGSAPRKRWPAEYWAKLALELAGRGKPVIVVGGPDDKVAAEEIRAATKDAPEIHVAVARLGLQGDIALMPLCAAHVSGDTGLLHGGLAMDVPTVALFGPNEPGWTGPHPRQQRVMVLQPPRETWPAGYSAAKDHTGELMRLIEPRQVADALKALLQ